MSLFNFIKQPENSNEPDFTIKKRGSKTKIFIDAQTKYDIILTSLASIKQSDNEDSSKKLGDKEDQELNPNQEY